MKKSALIALAAAIALPLLGGNSVAGSMDAKKGKRVAMKQCAACHDLSQDAAPRVGPPLWGVFGRAAGQAKNYEYSEAHMSKADSIIWDEATIDAYVQDPKALIPGNKMVYPVPGLPVMETKHRKWLIEYLKTLK
jgi:cytochrome c2